MTETKMFHVGDLASTVSKKLVAPSGYDAICRLVDFVTGVPHGQLGLVPAARAIRPHLISQHPWLAELPGLEDVVDIATARRWLDWAEGRYGTMHVVRALEANEYESLEFD